MKIVLNHNYEDIISVENILKAWQEFLRGKRNKPDVQKFSLQLMDNIFNLHYDLAYHTYKHGGYQQFKLNDPKPRLIHKANVRDRLLHHAVYRMLYTFFDKTFISDSFSCRNNKGMHKAINQFRKYSYIVSKNNTKTCWILKCDIKKFFASIDQQTLINVLRNRLEFRLSRDNLSRTLNLLKEIITSFEPNGLPLGNLTSQLFSNVYMNEFDQFVKHKLKAKYYIRYADDFVILSENKEHLKNIVPKMQYFLSNNLKLTMHPDKIYIKTLSSGIDFLGWVHFADHRVLRTATKRRMFARLKENPSSQTLNSYLGLLGHGNSKRVREKILYFT